MSEEKLPVGTRIRFIKELHEGATGDHPALLYAREGEEGEITGHNNFEGYMVKADSWPHPFGARRGDEFEATPAAPVLDKAPDEAITDSPEPDAAPVVATPDVVRNALLDAFDRSRELGEMPMLEPAPSSPDYSTVDPLTQAKAMRVAERCNYQVTGVVLTHRTLAKKAIVDTANVRWYPNVPEFMLMMTGKKETPGPGIQPAEADGDDLIGRAPEPASAPPVVVVAPAPSRPVLTAPPTAKLYATVESALGMVAEELGCVWNEEIPHNAGWFVPGKPTAYASALDAIKWLFVSLSNGGTVYAPKQEMKIEGEPPNVLDAEAIARKAQSIPVERKRKPVPEPEMLPQLGLF